MKILIVKTSALGDVIQTFPVVTELRRRFPDAEIDWVVEKPSVGLVQAHPHVTTAIEIDSKGWRTFSGISNLMTFRRRLRRKTYDLLFDLQGNCKSAIVTSFAKAKEKVGLTYQSAAEWPNAFFLHKRYDFPDGLNIREDYLSIVKQHFGEERRIPISPVLLKVAAEQKLELISLLLDARLKGGKPVLVCPGSAWINKQLPIEVLQEFLEKLKQRDNFRFLFTYGSSDEKQMALALHTHFFNSSILIDPLPLPMLQNLMDQVELVVAMDSLPLHLAGTTTTQTISFFGPSSADKYKPKGPQHKFFQGECPYGITFNKRCPKLRTCKTGACLREVSVDTLAGHLL